VNMIKSLKLMKKYSNCPDCGNNLLGKGEGSLVIEDETFTRTCKCGFSVTTDEEGVVLNEKR
jgi:iron(III) transport system ATP-binding protein